MIHKKIENYKGINEIVALSSLSSFHFIEERERTRAIDA
jgi:hypothetical protein